MHIQANMPEAAEGFAISGELFKPDARKRASGSALRLFLDLADEWGLTSKQRLLVLGQPSRDTLNQWVEMAHCGTMTLPLEVLLRISAIMAIHKGLKAIFPDLHSALHWARSVGAGPALGKKCPLDMILAGTQEDVAAIRRFIETWQGNVADRPRHELPTRQMRLA